MIHPSVYAPSFGSIAKKAFVVMAALLILSVGAVPGYGQNQPKGEFFFRDGDRVVVVGDSITLEGYYVNYLETFLRTRFPSWTIAVRNAGINGQTALMRLPHIDTDVFVWKPTVVVINYGMNDGRCADGVKDYRDGIVPYVEKLLARKLRVVLCSNSPLDLGDQPGKFTNYNKNFHEMAVFAEKFARERGIAFADQFHFCHDLWGRNRKREKPVPVTDQTLESGPADYVHARAPGQLTMIHVILKTLGAPAEVSHASVDAAKGAIAARNCEIRDFKKTDEGRRLAFVRADRASACWMKWGAGALELVPFQEELNRMTLQVTSLSSGTYELTIEGKVHGRFPSRSLAEGINLSLNLESAVYEVGRKVDAWAWDQRRESIVRARTGIIPFSDVDKLDAQTAAAAVPAPQRYELVRVEDREDK